MPQGYAGGRPRVGVETRVGRALAGALLLLVSLAGVPTTLLDDVVTTRLSLPREAVAMARPRSVETGRGVNSPSSHRRRYAYTFYNHSTTAFPVLCLTHDLRGDGYGPRQQVPAVDRFRPNPKAEDQIFMNP